MTKPGSRRAATAALIRRTATCASTTSLPSRWPQRLGLTWSSMCSPAAPASSSSCTVRAAFIGSPNPVSASTRAGSAVTRAICWRPARHLGERWSARCRAGRGRRRSPRRRRTRRRSRAASMRMRGQRVERAGEPQQPPGGQPGPEARPACPAAGVVIVQHQKIPLVCGCSPGLGDARQGQPGHLGRVQLGQPRRPGRGSGPGRPGRSRPRPGCGTWPRTARGRTGARPAGCASATAISSLDSCVPSVKVISTRPPKARLAGSGSW